MIIKNPVIIDRRTILSRTFNELAWEIVRFQRQYELRHTAFDSESFYKNNFENDNGLCKKMNIAKKYVKNWDSAKENNLGLVIFGDVGTGKSYMAAAIANALIDRFVSVRMTNCSNIINAIFKDNSIIDELDKFDLLILDDFGTERLTDFGEEQIYNIINGRYECGKPLIITTNLSLKEMKEPQSISGKRIFDRIWEMCSPVEIKGESIRKQIAKQKKAQLREMLFESETPDDVQDKCCESTGCGEEEPKIVEKKVFYGRMTPESESFKLAAEEEKKADQNCRQNAVDEL